MTVLSDSIHMGSMSPSSTIHFGLSVAVLARSRMMQEKSPVCVGVFLGGYSMKLIYPKAAAIDM